MYTQRDPIKPTRLSHCFQLIHSDLRRYRATGARNSTKVILTTQGFWASATARWLTYLHSRFKSVPIIGVIVGVFVTLHFKAVQIITGISLPVGTSIGPGLYIGHQDGVIVSGQAVIGANCNLSTQVVIGWGKQADRSGVPCLGNRVFVGPGAKIFGPITIGNDVAIGANAVVTRDLPDRAVAVGIPARIVSFHGSFDYICYDGMHKDTERLESLKQSSRHSPSLPSDPDTS